MKTRLYRSAMALFLICALAVSLCGCDALDYREAIRLFNAQEYDAAIDAFYALGEYEDSVALFTRSHYFAALSRMENGNYEEALPRFLKLGDYEDSAQRATECKYQLALAAFESGDLSTARNYFADAPDYRQTQEYLRRITWQDFFDALSASGSLQKEENGKTFTLTADSATQQLVFSVVQSKDLGYRFHDDLTLILSRDTLEADFTANSTFTMDFGGTQIGSQQMTSGKVSIPTCAADTLLVAQKFEKTVNDNLGKTTTSTDPAESLMDAAMQENFHDLMTVAPALLADAGISLTLADIGFTSLA